MALKLRPTGLFSSANPRLSGCLLPSQAIGLFPVRGVIKGRMLLTCYMDAKFGRLPSFLRLGGTSVV
jgi:hypothetical protein